MIEYISNTEFLFSFFLYMIGFFVGFKFLEIIFSKPINHNFIIVILGTITFLMISIYNYYFGFYI